MGRDPNTDKNGNAFSIETRRAVWKKAQTVGDYDPSEVRKDHCGAWINWDKYGVTKENGNGWEIDHKKPVASGGDDNLSNLQPLQWQNNREKGDDYPASDYCLVSAR